MRRALALVLAPLLLVPAVPSASATGPGPAGPAIPPDGMLDAASAWFLDLQTSEGCLAKAPGEEGSSMVTGWGTISLAAAGHDTASGDPSLVDGLAACPPEEGDELNMVSATARHILAIAAAGEDPASFDGTDWVDELRSYALGNQFVDPDRPEAINDDMFAILALRAAGVPASDSQIQQTASFLASQQNNDGGWGIAISGSLGDSATDTTTAALEALRQADALDPGDDAAEDALGFLTEHAQQDAGCFRYDASTSTPNVDSTAWAILGLLTLQEDPRADRWTTGGEGPWDCLRAHHVDGAGFATEIGGSSSDWLATSDAMLALASIPHGRVVPGMARPAAQLTADPPPTVGQATTLAADGAPYAGYKLPNGTVLEGPEATWQPEVAGEHAIDVLLIAHDGVADTRTLTVHVDAPDAPGGEPDEPDATPPTVHLPTNLTAERNVTFEIEVDTVPADEPVTSVKIAWGDGDTTGWQPATTATHTYTDLATLQITAWAKDAAGDVSDPAHANLTVEDAAPRIEIDGPRHANRDAPVTLTADARDPDGPDPTVTWTLPDGATTNGTETTLRMSTPGPHTVTATATDATGTRTTATHTLTAPNHAPANLTVTPGTLPPNSTTTLTADATDPDGDPIALTWRTADGTDVLGHGDELAIDTGPPGQRELIVNASDPYGGYLTATVTLTVSPDPDAASGPAETTTQDRHDTSDPAPASTGPASASPERPTLTLPGTIHVPADTRATIEGTAHDPDGEIARVQVLLGGSLPTTLDPDGTVTALTPRLPPGTYPITAHAVDAAGHTSPPENATLHVEDPDASPDGSDPLSPTEAHPIDPDQRDATPAGLLAPLAALLAAVLVHRRRRARR